MLHSVEMHTIDYIINTTMHLQLNVTFSKYNIYYNDNTQ